MYTSVTLIQQKIGRSLTADEASFADAVAIPAITGWINQYIGVTFDDANGTYTTYSNGGSSAVFIGLLSELTKVEYADAEDNVDLIDPTDYYHEGNWIFTRSGKPFLAGVRNIKITGKLADVPAVITLAATMMASKPLTYKGGREIDQEKIGDYQVTYSSLTTQAGAAALADDDVLTLLNQFKPMRLA